MLKAEQNERAAGLQRLLPASRRPSPICSLCEVGRGTPGGEYQRRFWHPICYVGELGEVPLRVRALGEDLVVFRDLNGRIGVLHLRCCHRNTSLEFGMITDKGIRCCYHGRVFDVDGTIVEMPGEPAADRLRSEASQGAYPTHVFGGIVFVYMGPPERIPAFPMLDRFKLRGRSACAGRAAAARLQLAAGERECGRSASHQHPARHSADARHGSLRQRVRQFPRADVGRYAGGRDLSRRRAGRTTRCGCARPRATAPTSTRSARSSRTAARSRRRAWPFMTFWTLPVDDDHSINFFVSHVGDDENDAVRAAPQARDVRPARGPAL